MPPATPEPSADVTAPLSRRAVLLGGAGLAGAALLSACSSSSTTQTGAGSATSTGGMAKSSAPSALLAIFDNTPAFSRAGMPQRFAFALGGSDGTPTKDAPEKLEFRITSGGKPVGAPITVDRHVDGVPIAYYPLRFTPEQPGIYQAAVTLNGKEATAAFQVGTEKDAKVPQVGEKLPSVETPTTADHRGVEPICTRKPEICELHEQSLATTLQAGKPIAFLISTPQFCQIGVCGPVLELLREQHTKQPGFSMVHAEVYKDTRAGNIQNADPAPAVTAFNLSYEPALFVAKADGTIVDRLDNVFDRTELAAALAKAS